VVVVVGGDVVVVVGGGGGGEVVGGAVGGLVGGGLVGAGPAGAGLFGLIGSDVGRVVVEDDGLEPGWDVGGTVPVVPEVDARSSVPFDLTVNQLFKKPCPAASDLE
jgi:hypothetical protein